uniref:Uncharacterized protein n=1 Tax=Oryza rufipogon TaxID=4529 RepID=A0A0E0MXU4_ORYRU
MHCAEPCHGWLAGHRRRISARCLMCNRTYSSVMGGRHARRCTEGGLWVAVRDVEAGAANSGREPELYSEFF